MVIEPMTEADISEVLAIETASFTVPWTEKMFRDELINPMSRPMVCRLDGSIAGYICAGIIIDEGHILDLAVHPSLRTHGIGAALMKETLGQLRASGCRSVFLEVRASHAGVISFYEKNGFCVLSVRKCYYVKPLDDAAIMQLKF
jgi:ribosomal-protein-alanine N-acetyltransferase